MTTHEAGWAHAAGALDGPSWLRVPDDVNALHPLLWSGTARRTDDGGVEVGGVDLRDLLAEHNSPAYVLDEADFRQRAQAFRDAFKDYDVFYAGKAFLCTTVARWVQEEGLNLDVCSPGELTVALRAGVDPSRIGYHGNNKTYPELRRAVHAGVGRIVVDSFHEIERLAEIVGAEGKSQNVMIRVTAGVEAHTHEYIATAHEDQKFGFSITNGDAWRAVEQVAGRRRTEPPRPPLPHRLARSSTAPASRSRPDGCSRSRPASARSSASPSPRWTSAAASASRTPPRTTRATPRSSPPR